MAKLVSKTYGDALFELAVEEDKLDTLLEEAEAAERVLKENDEFVKLMCHPKLDAEEKAALLENVFKGRVSEEFMGFLQTVEAKGRFKEILAILGHFVESSREYKGIGMAYVTSAVALTDPEKKALEDKLLETTSYKSFVMDYKVDPSLVGGLVIRIGDRVVDSSIKTKLGQMAKSLSAIQLNNV